MPLFLAQRRLVNQRLVHSAISEPADVVRWLGAVQAQDYHGAKWGIAQRMTGTTDAALDAAFDRGEILRTHLLRPTWHVVAPDDIRWLLALTAPRVHALNAYMYRQTALDANVLAEAHRLLSFALEGGNARTRKQLGDVLRDHGIEADSLRLGYILMHAELEALVCSGPMQGRQQTYALLDERVPLAPGRSRDEALSELAVRFFRSHGPAQARDLARWASFSITESRRAIDLAADRLDCAVIGGDPWWSGPPSPPSNESKPIVRLLPNYDEYISGDAIVARTTGNDPTQMRSLVEAGRLDAHFLLIDGQLRGGWRRRLTSKSLTVSIDPWGPLDKAEIEAAQTEATRYAAFLGKHLDLSWTG